MSDPNLSPEVGKELEDELSALSKQQLIALQFAAFIPMSAQEANEFDDRGIRIGQIYQLLERFGAPSILFKALTSTAYNA
jgi:hypothetical protein